MEDPQGSSPHEAVAPTATASYANSNYLVRQWRGELSLGVSFWVNNILATVVLAAIGASLGAWVARSQSNYSVAAMWIAWWLCTVRTRGHGRCDREQRSRAGACRAGPAGDVRSTMTTRPGSGARQTAIIFR